MLVRTFTVEKKVQPTRKKVIFPWATTYSRSLSSSLALVDASIALTDFSRGVTDPLSLMDQITNINQHNQSAANALGLSDTVSINIAAVRSLEDSLNLSDAVRSDNFPITVVTDLNLSDFVTQVTASGVSDTYATLAEANEYFQTRIRSSLWYSNNSNDRQIALEQATAAIDDLNFTGRKTSKTQTLEFPRSGDLITPNDIKIACCEIAFAMLSNSSKDEDLSVTGEGYSSVRATYDKSINLPHLASGIPSIVAWQYLLSYLVDRNTFTRHRTS